MQPTPLFFAHANGFPASCYRVLFQYLAPNPIRYIDVFGEHRAKPRSWKEIADEIIEFLSDAPEGPVVGVGHSFGGVGIFYAARKRPDLFSRIILLDPPFLEWRKRWLMVPFQLLGLASMVVPPSKRALKRTDWFENREEARKYFSGKPFFQSFHPDALEDYLTHGLAPSGDGLTLRISKEREADYFASFPTIIGSTALKIPGNYVIPEGKVAIPVSSYAENRKKFRHFTWHQLPGNHMFPLEHPRETATLIRDILNT